MKKVIFAFTGIMIFLFISNSNIYSFKFDIELEKKIIAKVLNRFYLASRQSKFKEIIKLTTGKEKTIYENRLKQINRNNGLVNQTIKNYFKRLVDFTVEIVEIDKKGKIAFSICILHFKYYDSNNRTPIFKKREVNYYLQKIDGSWKIAKSKLRRETYYYKSKVHPKKIVKY